MVRLSLFVVLGWFSVPHFCYGVKWERGWERQDDSPHHLTEMDPLRAAQLSAQVDSLQSAREAIKAWRAMVAAEPAKPERWIELAKLHLLEGAAYQSGRRERLACYQAALSASERAMACNPAFLAQVRAGRQPWEAAQELGSDQMGAMNFWVTGIFYIFRDCLGFLGRIRHASLMTAARSMIDRMDTVDPNWEGQANTFSRGIYYLAMPRSQGGDREKARQCFERAINAAPERTLARWGRGKYFYPAMGETEAARADLKVVATSNLAQLSGDPAWNRYIKKDAAALLAKFRRE